jgi:hypothetical protein
MARRRGAVRPPDDLDAARTGVTAFGLFVILVGQAIFVFVFVRFGLVALVSYLFFSRTLELLPLFARADWRSEFSIVTLAVVAGIM